MIYASMVFLSFIGAVLELMGIAILLHTILSLLQPGFIDHNIFTSYLYKLFQIQDNRQFVVLMSFLLLGIYVVKNLGIIVTNKLQVKKAAHITDLMSDKLYKSIANKELLFFTQNKSSDIIHRLIVASVQMPESILLPSIIIISEVGVVILLLSGILVYQPLLFLMVCATLIPTAFLLIILNRKTLQKQGAELNTQVPKIMENITELTHGMSIIKLWNGSAFFIKEFTRFKKKILKLKESIYMSSYFIPMRIYEVIAISGILIVVLYGIKRGFQMEVIVSFISIYAGIAFRLLPSVNRIIGSSNALATYNYILDYYAETNDFKQENTNVVKLNFADKFELKGINFSYFDENPILKELDLNVNKGDFIGIIGESGAGKSTLVNIVTSLIRPNSGSVSIDGVEVGNEELGGYRFLFSYVRQDVFMLNSSILSNIAFLEQEPDLEKAKNCLSEVNLLHWVDSLDNGWNTVVGELGSAISGGQRQRIALARAFYKNAEIFIFDEVTNNLDTYSKEQTLLAINKLKSAGKTAIFISHKNDELELCDRVYKLENKSLVEV